MTKEDLELFIQFKQLMQGNMEPVKKKTRREKGTESITILSGKRKRPILLLLLLVIQSLK